MAGFMQLIEFTTSRIDEVRKLNDEWADDHPDTGPMRVTVTADRDQPNTYVSLAEFGSYDEAMRNSDQPRTNDWYEQMSALCDGSLTFRNLDVIHQEARMDQAKPVAAT